MEGYFHLKDNKRMRYRSFSLIGFLLAALVLVLASQAASAQVSKQNTLAIEQRLSDLGYWITKVDNKRDDSTRQAIIAFQKVEGRKRTGVLSAADLALLETAARPTAKYPEGPAHVEVDIGRQVLFYVGDDGVVKHIVSVSTGSEKRYFDQGEWQTAHTTRGKYKVTWKYNGIRKASLGDLYYPSYFNGGIAVHGSPSIPTYPASHGCVRVPLFADQALYKLMPVGTPVYVYDKI
jgi:lipoprotein-anchoring transpeptidase ErfK/SrfK